LIRIDEQHETLLSATREISYCIHVVQSVIEKVVWTGESGNTGCLKHALNHEKLECGSFEIQNVCWSTHILEQTAPKIHVGSVLHSNIEQFDAGRPGA
jgi:hypothetical protein